MNKEELIYEASLTYTELVYYLLDKYGPAKHDYFHRIPQGVLGSHNKTVSRTNEGLICHHIYEDRGGNLGSPHSAVFQPLEWQKKENLVYCNMLEHLLLHIKIAILRQKKYKFSSPIDIENFFTTHGINMICYDINQLFLLSGEVNSWQKKCYPAIRDNYNEYVVMIKALLKYIECQCQEFDREKRFIKIGSIIKFADGVGTIIGWSHLKDKVVFDHDGNKGAVDVQHLQQQLTFYDYWDLAARKLCALVKDYASGELQLHEELYKDVRKTQDDMASILAQALSVDFHGFGFPMFAAYSLNKAQFGSNNADEYIYKGLPSFVNSEESKTLTSKTPHFWIGKLPPEIENGDYYYIIRIKTAFHHRSNNPPFIRYKEPDLIRGRSPFIIDEDQNLLTKKGVILSDSSIIIHDKKVDWIKNSSGEKERVTVTLTLGRDDYELFKREHRILSIEYLDGCYFQ